MIRQAEQLRDGVRQAYSAAAENPEAEHPFPIGRQFAESLDYPPELLADLPTVAVEAFAGVSNVAIFADIAQGTTVLDLGCGAGLDSLIAAKRVGAAGRVIGIDFSEAMLTRAKRAAAKASLDNTEFHKVDAEQLLLEDASIDVALVNGIFNLNPARDLIFRELARVVRPGGAVYGAELILREPLSPEEQASESNWFAWIAGAKEGGAFLAEFRAAGFREVRFLRAQRNARTKNPHVLAADVYAQK